VDSHHFNSRKDEPEEDIASLFKDLFGSHGKGRSTPKFPDLSDAPNTSGIAKYCIDKMVEIVKYMDYQVKEVATMKEIVRRMAIEKSEDEIRDARFKDAINSFTLPD